MRYTSSITAGSLKVPESRVIAGLMLRGLKTKEFQQAIRDENVLQTRSKNTSQGLANLIRRRLKHLPEPMLKLVRDGSVIEATHACLAAAIMDSFLLGDFLDLVMRPLYRTFKETLPMSSWRDYLEGCQGRDPDMIRWTEETTSRLRSSVFKSLAEAGYLNNTRERRLQKVHIVRPVLRHLEETNNKFVLRCVEVAQ
jgi:Putative inner membrane protein (DUF1819)